MYDKIHYKLKKKKYSTKKKKKKKVSASLSPLINTCPLFLSFILLSPDEIFPLMCLAESVYCQGRHFTFSVLYSFVSRWNLPSYVLSRICLLPRRAFHFGLYPQVFSKFLLSYGSASFSWSLLSSSYILLSSFIQDST